jgi:hypothetical protein
VRNFLRNMALRNLRGHRGIEKVGVDQKMGHIAVLFVERGNDAQF